MDRANIEKIAQSREDKVLLAHLWDKVSVAIAKNIPASTCFLSPREQEMAQYLFGNRVGLHFFGGYADATRKMLVYLPDYLGETALWDNPPLCCLRATFYEADTLSHRDFLGALMGSGIGRETIGDICVDKGSCDFFTTKEIAPYLLANLESAGRARLRLTEIPVKQAHIPQPETQEVKDTLASIRLDSVISSGFRISRSSAVQWITSGKATLNGLACEKPDKAVEQGAVISVRTLGKIVLKQIGGQTKKGRISVIIDRYL